MKIKDIIELIKDNKLYFEIKEKASGASFGIFNNKDVVMDLLLEKEVKAINTQYINGKRLIIIEF